MFVLPTFRNPKTPKSTITQIVSFCLFQVLRLLTYLSALLHPDRPYYYILNSLPHPSQLTTGTPSFTEKKKRKKLKIVKASRNTAGYLITPQQSIPWILTSWQWSRRWAIDSAFCLHIGKLVAIELYENSSFGIDLAYSSYLLTLTLTLLLELIISIFVVWYSSCNFTCTNIFQVLTQVYPLIGIITTERKIIYKLIVPLK